MNEHMLILLVEDNPEDVIMARITLKDINIKNPVVVVSDGEEALDYLYKRGEYADAISPDLIILDLNLPKISGYDVLKEIKSNETFRTIPVIVFTVSTNEQDVETAYKLGANSFIQKPAEPDEMRDVFTVLLRYWLDIVKTPGW